MRISTQRRISLYSSAVAGVLVLITLLSTNAFFFESWTRSARKQIVQTIQEELREDIRTERREEIGGGMRPLPVRPPIFDRQTSTYSPQEFSRVFPSLRPVPGIQRVNEDSRVYVLPVITNSVELVGVANVSDPVLRQRSLVWISLITVLISMIITYWVMRKVVTIALRDLIELAQRVEEIGQDRMRLEHTLHDLPTDDPLRTIADEVSVMVSRLDQHIQSTKQFVANASHELRTPLMILRSGIDKGLQQGMEQAELTRQLDVLDQIDHLLSGLLSIASIHRQERISVPMMDILISTVTTLQGRYSIPCTLSGSLPNQIEAVAGSRESIIRNVLENARTHSNSDGEDTVISVVCSDTQCIVSNPGTLTDDQINHLREPFWTGDVARTTTGHGLGLSIVKSFVEANGRTINASSQNGQISVTISFPA